MDSEGEGEGGMIWESGIQVHEAHSSVNKFNFKRSSPRFIIIKLSKTKTPVKTGAGALRQPREGGGRGIPDGEHVYTCGGFMLMYGKTNTIL